MCGVGGPGSSTVRWALRWGLITGPPDGRAGGRASHPGRPGWQPALLSAALIKTGPWRGAPLALQLPPVVCRPLFLPPACLCSLFSHKLALVPR